MMMASRHQEEGVAGRPSRSGQHQSNTSPTPVQHQSNTSATPAKDRRQSPKGINPKDQSTRKESTNRTVNPKEINNVYITIHEPR
jgi:hypothetical protein